jgi:hypothetical protein
MHPDLDKWLNEVWQARTEIFNGFTQNGRAIHAAPVLEHKGVSRIYKMYTRGDAAGSGAGGDSAGIPEFLRDLSKLIEKRQATCVIQDSHWHTVYSDHLDHLANGGSVEFELEGDEENPNMCVKTQESIIADFIHVRHKTNFGKALDQRIYLNLAGDGRGGHFAAVVDAVYDHDGFRSAKVSCPGSAPRNDTALLYVADEKAVTFALDRLREFQKAKSAAFLPGLPRLTSPVDGLTGVGRGMEPPKYVVIREGGTYYKKRSGMSFGLWRSALIFMALDRTYWTRAGESDSQRRDGFKRRAAKYFRAAGIDPDNPSVQTNPDSLPEYSGSGQR